MGSVNIAFIVLSIVVFIMVISAIPRRGKRTNMAHYAFAGWTSLTLLLYTINAVRWRGNFLNSAPAYCDFSTMFFVMYMMAVPACCLALSYRLFMRLRPVEKDKGIVDDIYAVTTDLFLCLGLPLIQMASRFIFHGKNRFTIYEDFGCYQDVFKSATSQSLVYVPLMAVSLVSLGYLVPCVFLWNRMDHAFDMCHYANDPAKRGEPVTPSVFYRHALFAAIGSLVTFIFSLWQMIMNLAFGSVLTGINEASQQEAGTDNFSEIMFENFETWQRDIMRSTTVEFSRWIIIALGLVFFFMFGPIFSTECQRGYVAIFKSTVGGIKGFVRSTKDAPNLNVSVGFPQVFRHQSSQEKAASAASTNATAISMDMTGSHTDALKGLPIWIDPSAFPSKPQQTYPVSTAPTMTSETLVPLEFLGNNNNGPDVPSDVSSKHESVVIPSTVSSYNYSSNTIVSSHPSNRQSQHPPSSRGKYHSTLSVPETVASVYSMESAARTHSVALSAYTPQRVPSRGKRIPPPKVPEHGSFLILEPQTPHSDAKWHSAQAV